MDLEQIEAALRADPEVRSVHDVHWWTVTSGLVAFTAHIELATASEATATVRRASDLLHDRFGIGHVTLQPEPTTTVTIAPLDAPVDPSNR